MREVKGGNGRKNHKWVVDFEGKISSFGHLSIKMSMRQTHDPNMLFCLLFYFYKVVVLLNLKNIVIYKF